MIRSLFTVSGFTLLSRLLGFVRDVLIARYLGAGALADVWVAAFRFPNLFRRIFGEGAFNAGFVPMYSRRLEEGEEVADRFARRTISVMFVILMTLFILCFIFMEPLVKATAWGFEEDGRLDLAVPASRITLGYLVFICLVAALTGILNSRRIFAAPAFAYVVLNFVFLGALLFVIPGSEDPLSVLCWSVMVAGVLQLGVVAVACYRHGVNLRPRTPKIDPEIKRLGALMGPGLVSAGIQQLNLIIGQAVASLATGGIAILYYADRLNQMPLGLIGMAMGTVLLPEISRRLGSGDDKGANRSLCQGMEIALLLCLPACVAMVVIPRELMQLFQSGEFTEESAKIAGWVLAAFAIGTPTYVIARVLQPAYFAREDTRTPMRFTIASAMTNIVLVYPLFRWLGPMGCALATSVAGWVNVTLLWIGLRRSGFMQPIDGFVSRIIRMLIASVLMALVVYFLAHSARGFLIEDPRYTIRVVSLFVVVILGAIAYFVFIIALRIYSLPELKAKLKR